MACWTSTNRCPLAALAACFVGSEAEPRFALGFWLNETNQSGAAASRSQAGLGGFYHEGLESLVVAAGAGNQRLYAIPSLDLVAARLGNPDRSWRDREFLDLLIAARELPHGGSP
jgi:hypothetical protein